MNIFNKIYKLISTKNAQESIEGSIVQKKQLERLNFENYTEYLNQTNRGDHAHYGLWQIKYGEMFNYLISLHDKKVLDVGCASGAMMFSFYEQGAEVYGCDVNETAIQRSPFESIKENILHIDTTEIHKHFKLKFNFIHSQQVFEHFPGKEYSEKVVKSILHVLDDYGIIYIALACGEHLSEDELIKMHNAGIDVDITHINLWPKEFWRQIFAKHRLIDASYIYEPIINCYQYPTGDHQVFSFFQEYHWDQFILVKNPDSHLEAASQRIEMMLQNQKDFADTRIYKEVLSRPCHPKIADIILRYI